MKKKMEKFKLNMDPKFLLTLKSIKYIYLKCQLEKHEKMIKDQNKIKILSLDYKGSKKMENILWLNLKIISYLLIFSDYNMGDFF